jgi:osmoprotectant transport system permease protein
MRPVVLSDVLQDLLEEGIGLLGEHLVLVLSAILLASAIAIPAGLLLTQHPRARNWALGVASVGQTIPSLALFGFLIPIPFIGGIGQHTAIIALVLYALLPILRNTVTGILGVDPIVRDSAVAMGMTRAQILRMIELPLAAPTIVAGLRIATVTTIGTATIAAAIGAGGLGVFIFRGIASVDKLQILAGAIPAALLALAADGALGWLEKRWSAR